jgi:type VI secretion system VasD/TssJ family lipoprotein
MSRRRLLAWIGLMPAWWLGAPPRRAQAQPTAARGNALVIGNAQYAQAPLANPENDARLVAETMKSLGFDVTVRYNLKAREFKRVLREFGRRLEEDDTAAVFFYAVHGVQIDRQNYLLPVDLDLRDEGEVKDEAIDLEETLLSRIDRVRPRARIFIIDACRDNPFARRTRSAKVGGGLAEMAAPGALIAFSAAPGHTAEDGPPGTNSIYTRYLAQEMKAEGVEIEEMLKNVRIKVLRDTQQRQVPWVNTSMVVNFVFNPGSGGPLLARAAPVVALPSAPRAAAPAPAGPGIVRSLRLSIQAQRWVPPEELRDGPSLALRIYVLSDGYPFERASYESLRDSDQSMLGTALLRREIVQLRQGEARELVLTIGADARVVAVFAAFNELPGRRARNASQRSTAEVDELQRRPGRQTQWRTELTLPADGALPPARLAVQARQVQLAWER